MLLNTPLMSVIYVTGNENMAKFRSVFLNPACFFCRRQPCDYPCIHCCCCWSETCTVCRCISSMSRYHGNPSTRIPRLFEVAAARRFQVERSGTDGSGRSLRTGRPPPSSWPSRWACYADCRQPTPPPGRHIIIHQPHIKGTAVLEMCGTNKYLLI